MANEVRFSSAMPAEEVNGLKSASKDMLDDPRKLRIIVGIIDVPEATIKFTKGIQIPKPQFRHVELVLEKDIPAAQKLLAKALAARTGAAELPFPPGDEAPLDFEDDDSWADGAGSEGEEPPGVSIG